jgi:AcrR family transcriptional regulator
MKRSILQKAAELFLKYGFKSVTMDDIASELGMSKKTIYANFETKLLLIKEVTFFVFDEINEGIQQICSANFSPIEEIYEIKSLVSRQLHNEESYPMYQLQKYYPKIYKELHEKQLNMVKTCVSENLKKGIELGLYRKEININFITRIYFNGVMGIKNMELFPQEEFSSSYLMESYLDYHLRGITTEKGLQLLIQVQK